MLLLSLFGDFVGVDRGVGVFCCSSQRNGLQRGVSLTESLEFV